MSNVQMRAIPNASTCLCSCFQGSIVKEAVGIGRKEAMIDFKEEGKEGCQNKTTTKKRFYVIVREKKIDYLSDSLPFPKYSR